MSSRRRLDAELVRRRIAPSREAARRLVEERAVLVNGSVADKPARQVHPGDDVKLIGAKPKFVSRAGAKLEAGLDRFVIDPAGLICLDAGSSTGGFSDCLIQRGAAHVYAVDVGTNQLHEKLRANPRVTVNEKTDIRSVNQTMTAGPVDLVVGDLSFISLRLVLGNLISMVEVGNALLLLIKPQFEAGKIEASRGKGVIADPTIWRRVILEVADAALGAGAAMLGLMTSPVTGSSGNVEFIAHLQRRPAPVQSAHAAAGINLLVEGAIGEAVAKAPQSAEGPRR